MTDEVIRLLQLAASGDMAAAGRALRLGIRFNHLPFILDAVQSLVFDVPRSMRGGRYPWPTGIHPHYEAMVREALRRHTHALVLDRVAGRVYAKCSCCQWGMHIAERLQVTALMWRIEQKFYDVHHIEHASTHLRIANIARLLPNPQPPSFPGCAGCGNRNSELPLRAMAIHRCEVCSHLWSPADRRVVALADPLNALVIYRDALRVAIGPAQLWYANVFDRYRGWMSWLTCWPRWGEYQTSLNWETDYIAHLADSAQSACIYTNGVVECGRICPPLPEVVLPLYIGEPHSS